jgi:hypothetical protein
LDPRVMKSRRLDSLCYEDVHSLLSWPELFGGLQKSKSVRVMRIQNFNCKIRSKSLRQWYTNAITVSGHCQSSIFCLKHTFLKLDSVSRLQVKPIQLGLFMISRRKWEDNIEMEFGEIWCGCDVIILVEDQKK